MKTERLFDTDVRLLKFEATVVSCSPAGDGRFLVALDRTAFFPEGGGQGADQGILGGAAVLDAHEKDGVIFHLTDLPLEAGERVFGEVSGVRRLSMMQQHTGEHILTGIAHMRWGVENVGFHIGTEAVTVDFSLQLTEAQVRELETAANEAVWANLPVEVWIPSPEELAALEYRSKKAIEGDVRIVRIPGIDTCACCGTHVEKTGEVGQIRIVSAIHYKGGTRLQILCGMRALAWEQAEQDENRAVSRLLSARPGELAPAVSRLMAERDALKQRLDEMAMAALERTAEKEKDRRVRVADVTGMDPGNLARAASRLGGGAECALAVLRSGDGWRFALCSKESAALTKRLCARFGGRGGGRDGMSQGTLGTGGPEAFRACLEEET